MLERFYVGAKDRAYHPDDKRDWERNPLSIDLWTKQVFILRRSNDSFGESLGQKMENIHYNSVAAGLCAYPEDYKYSSAKFYESEVDDPIAFGLI